MTFPSKEDIVNKVRAAIQAGASLTEIRNLIPGSEGILADVLREQEQANIAPPPGAWEDVAREFPPLTTRQPGPSPAVNPQAQRPPQPGLSPLSESAGTTPTSTRSFPLSESAGTTPTSTRSFPLSESAV